MGGPLQQLVHKRGYRERGQAAHRAHRHKTLEKKKDWQQRSKRYKKQQELLRHLSEKARTKNPNEWSCKQLRAQQIGGGVEGSRPKHAGLVRLTRQDAEAAFAARSPAAAAAAATEVLRSSALTSLVSQRSQGRLRETKRQLAKAQEKAVSSAAALLQLKQQTLRQQVKKQAAALGRGFAKGGKANSHLIWDSDGEEEDTQQQQQQHQVERVAGGISDESGSDFESSWIMQMAKKPRSRAATAAATAEDEEDSDGDSSKSSEEEAADSGEAYQQMQKALLHAQRLRRLQQQLQQHRDEQKGGRRRQVLTQGSDGKELKSTKWFQERKK